MSNLLRELELQHVIYGWQKQSSRSPAIFERADRIYLWDTDGQRYADFCSGQVNVNLGYGHPQVLEALRAQMERTTYIAPMFATESRIRLCSLIAESAPGDLNYVFLTNSGSESIENAIKIARAVTGRSKVYSAWQSYHGATAGASAISGDPRRLFVEPAMPGFSKFHYAACYRCPFGQDEPPSCRFACLRSLVNQIAHEGPETIAAIVIEPIVGTSGLYIPPPEFLTGIREVCDANEILLIFDETMTGWGRTGNWFACEHSGVVPDILVTAKGITSGYVPLGATIVSPGIRAHFENTPFVGGLTNEGHPLACAAGIATIEAYRREELITRSAILGEYLAASLLKLKERHPCVGDVRCQGLFACLELSRNRLSRMPLAGHRNRISNVADGIVRRLFDMGLIVIAKWDFLFIAPPLIITKEEIDEGLRKIDEVLFATDELTNP